MLLELIYDNRRDGPKDKAGVQCRSNVGPVSYRKLSGHIGLPCLEGIASLSVLRT